MIAHQNNETANKARHYEEGIDMYTADMLIQKLKEIEEVIRQHKNSDGTCRFDAKPAYIAIELAERVITDGINEAGNLEWND